MLKRIAPTLFALLTIVTVVVGCSTSQQGFDALATDRNGPPTDPKLYVGKFVGGGVEFEIAMSADSSLTVTKYHYTYPDGRKRDFTPEIRIARDGQGFQIIGPTFRIVKLVPTGDGTMRMLQGDVEIRGSMVGRGMIYVREE